MRHTSKRQYEWSDNIAYAVGLMASDGCLSSDGRHLDLTSIDIEQLENFMAAIGRKLKVSIKDNGRGDMAYRVQFSDVSLYDFLLSAGLTPRKSLTLSNVRIADKYYPSFLRGLFDGDGSCYAYNDPRWPTSFVFYTNFSAANRQFLEFIQYQNYRLFNLIGGSIRKSPRVYTLAYGKADSKKLFDFFYPDGVSVLSLSRKRIKLRGFIEKDSMVK